MIKIKVLCKWFDCKNVSGLKLPSYQTEESAGMDVCLAIQEPYILQPQEISLFPTNLVLAIPTGFEIQVRPRSGMAVKHGITLINSPGTIDADYRGEVKIGLINLGGVPYTFERGERVAQMILAPVVQATLELASDLGGTERGDGGFGHTGNV